MITKQITSENAKLSLNYTFNWNPKKLITEAFFMKNLRNAVCEIYQNFSSKQKIQI